MLRWGVAAKAIPSPPTPALPRSRAVPSHSRRHRLRPRSAQKPTNEERGEGNALAGVLSKSVLLRSGVALFALGFVDAGYSGDWSRIGAISKDTEELLKLGAYVVVPLCLALVFSASQHSSTD